MPDWIRAWAALDTVTALPDAAAEFMIGDEDAPNDVINRTAKQLNGWLEELAASGLGNNFIPNGSFELWPGDITNVAPTGYTLKGTPTDVSRDTGERDGFGGTFSAKITSNGAGNEGLTITLSNLKASTSYFLSVRAKVTAGDTARIWTTGGSTNLDTNTSSTSWVTLSGEIITDGTPTNVILNFGSNTATDIVWFDKLMLQEGEVPAIFSPQKTIPGKIIQVVNVMDGAVATTTTQIPWDDTIPQNTEGAEFMSLTITPTDVNNKLIIDVIAFLGNTGTGIFAIGALFQDSGANAIASGAEYIPATGQMHAVTFRYYMTAGTTSPTTFKFRAGPQTATTITFNGAQSARKLGGVMASSITIMESSN